MNVDSITAIYASIPTDWMIIGVFAIFAAFDALRSGARRTVQLALALPLAAILVVSLSSATVLGSIVGQFSTPILQAILFFIILAIMYVVIGRIGLSWGEETGQTIQAALTGVAATAVVLVFWLQIPALGALWHFGPQVEVIFGEGYRFFWLIGSYAALAFVRAS